MTAPVAAHTIDIVVLVDVVLQSGEARQSQDEAEEGEGQPEERQHCSNGTPKLACEFAAATAPCRDQTHLPQILAIKSTTNRKSE